MLCAEARGTAAQPWASMDRLCGDISAKRHAPNIRRQTRYRIVQSILIVLPGSTRPFGLPRS